MRPFLIGATAFALMACVPVAQAGTAETSATTDSDSATVLARRQSHTGPMIRPHRRKASSVRCRYHQGPLVYQVANDLGIEVPPPGRQGRWFTVSCKTPDSPEYTYDLRYIPLRSLSATEAVDLIEEARRQLLLPEPEIHTSPPSGADSVVGVPVFLWIPQEAWQAEEATAEIPGVVVAVRAEPQRVVWTMGDGGQVECQGPGEPWDPSLGEDAQPSSCRYTYRSTSVGQPDERFPVSVTVYWKATWTVDGAPGGGDLGEIARSATTSVRVAQIQTVNVH
jgi:hypothetical protein